MKSLGIEGFLYAIDRDPVAVDQARQRFADDARFRIFQMNFADIAVLAETEGLRHALDGVLVDLGVSSPQLDEAGRGFSFIKDGPLDMRMDPSAGETAAAWLKRADVSEMIQVFKDYGEERFAGRIARAIDRQRRESEIVSTGQLAEIVKQAHPKWERGKHPATRVFQAIRIHINGELEALKTFLQNVAQLLKTGGRLVVISFHSLEDRIVKRFMRSGFNVQTVPRNLPLPAQLEHPFRVIAKPVYPGEKEVQNNPRARSSVLRVAEKCI